MINVGSGTANYKGELVNPGEFGILKPNITIGAEYYFFPRISTRAQLTWFQIAGDDAKADDDRRQRNLSFKSSNIEFSAIGIVNLGPQGDRYYDRPLLNFHGFIGVGLLYFNPKTEYEGKMHALQPLKTEGVAYSRLQPVIPMGLGARINVSPVLNVLIEGGYRLTFTDYLDDVSRKRYLGPDAFGGDPNSLAYKLSDRRPEIGTVPGGDIVPDYEQRTTKGVRGNPETNDGYFILNLSVQYYLPSEIFKSSQRKLYTIKRKNYYNKPRKR